MMKVQTLPKRARYPLNIRLAPIAVRQCIVTLQGLL
jgi:hypothetical protein